MIGFRCTISFLRASLPAAVLVLASATVVVSQAEHPLDILKLKWERQARLPRNFDPSIISTGTSFNDPLTRAPSLAGVSSSTTEFKKTPSQAPEPNDVFPITPGRMPVFYVYSLKVRNAGNKTIQGVAWDYIFLDAAGSKPVGAHQFLSYQKLGPRKSVTFELAMRSPPVTVIEAGAKKNSRSKFIEKAVIECVLYADGSSWRNALGREGTCDLLKSSKPAR